MIGNDYYKILYLSQKWAGHFRVCGSKCTIKSIMKIWHLYVQSFSCLATPLICTSSGEFIAPLKCRSIDGRNRIYSGHTNTHKLLPIQLGFCTLHIDHWAPLWHHSTVHMDAPNQTIIFGLVWCMMMMLLVSTLNNEKKSYFCLYATNLIRFSDKLSKYIVMKHISCSIHTLIWNRSNNLR